MNKYVQHVDTSNVSKSIPLNGESVTYYLGQLISGTTVCINPTENVLCKNEFSKLQKAEK